MRAAGAPAQRPTQGARTTRMAAGSTLPASSAKSFSAPASMQLIESHTLMVSGAGCGSPSLTTSK